VRLSLRHSPGVRLLGLATLLAANFPLQLHAQTQVTAASVNGVLNPTQFTGADIGDQVNKAWASGLGRTVRIPPGSWSFTHTIVHPGLGYLLQCDAGTVLTYTGTGDAITLSNGNPTGASGAGIDGTGGCQLIGTGVTGTNGIHIFYSNHTFVRNMRISNFNTGINDSGGNSVELQTLSIHNNTNGIFIAGSDSPAGAANAVHLSNSEITANAQWGFWSEDSGCSCTNNLGNTITSNVFENNGYGDVFLDWDYGSSVTGNYFGSTGPGVAIGNNENNWGITVARNHFNSSSSTSDRITIGYGAYFHIEENAELGSTSTGCFIDVITGPYGYATNFFGVGTNLARSTHEWCLHGTGTTNP
jgi:hypothetical protein